MIALHHPGAVVHHSASPPETTPDEIRRWHVEDNGWGDIGYHDLIHLTAQGWTRTCGRSLGQRGAHDFGANDYIGVCVCGDYTEQELPLEARRLLVETLADHANDYSFGADDIYGHHEQAEGERDVDTTECPGFPIEPIRQAVAAELVRRAVVARASMGAAVFTQPTLTA